MTKGAQENCSTEKRITTKFWIRGPWNVHEGERKGLAFFATATAECSWWRRQIKLLFNLSEEYLHATESVRHVAMSVATLLLRRVWKCVVTFVGLKAPHTLPSIRYFGRRIAARRIDSKIWQVLCFKDDRNCKTMGRHLWTDVHNLHTNDRSGGQDTSEK